MIPFYYLRFSGEQTAALLQGQMTNDVALLDTMPTLLSAYANIKGRCRGIFYASRFQQDYIWAVPFDKAVALQCLKSMKMVAPFSRVTVSLIENWQTIALKNPTEEVLAQAKTSGCLVLRSFEALPVTLIAGPESDFLSTLPSMNTSAFQTTLIEHKIPTITEKTIDAFLPHHINLIELNAVSFNKGCYIGQEIIARMHYKGTIKKKLHYLEASTPISFSCGNTCVSNMGETVEIVNISENKKKILAILSNEEELCFKIHQTSAPETIEFIKKML